MNQQQGQQHAGQLQEGGNAQPAQIQVKVVVNVQQSNLNLSINIDPDIPFSVFAECINQQIFALLMKVQYEETIEYQLLNGVSITQQERRTLAQLGFVNECSLNVTLTPQQMIEVRIIFHQPGYHAINISINTNHNIPFNEFTNGFKDHLIKQNVALKEIEYELENVGIIKTQEVRNLADLGFFQGSNLILKFRQPPICPVHKELITNICIQDHACQNRRLCVECVIQHKQVSKTYMPSLKKFKEKVQQNIIPDFDCSRLLNQVKTFEINVNLIISSFLYQTKRLIKSLQNIYNEISNVKNILENLWPDKLSEKELDEMIQFYDGNTLNDDKQKKEKFVKDSLENIVSITQNLNNLNQFPQQLDKTLPDLNQKIVIKVVDLCFDNKFDLYIDPEAPFNVFIDKINSMFRQNTQQNQIVYFKINGNINIYQHEVRTLAELGFVNQCMLVVTK